MDKLLEKIGEHKEDTAPPAIYMASTMVDQWLPGFRKENDIDVPGADPLVSIWMGNRSRIGAHYDLPDNIACSVIGRRRFTLFPPDQISNLYPGPLDFSPGGQAISVVDFHNPDYQRFPKFRSALENAQLAELEPGDAVFVPSMWWHHVESLDSFNVLINYWWRQSPHFMSTPMSTLHHALLTIRDLPPRQRLAWKEIFNSLTSILFRGDVDLDPRYYRLLDYYQKNFQLVHFLFFQFHQKLYQLYLVLLYFLLFEVY
jgi:hypothetical protein